ncbi:plasma kallikrein-like protein [Lasius niger]|uniref:Vitamin K-dependent protein C n=1 Tax=Lasius niger TaxID=67767 RepID=A0A0J7K7Q2_LASNI|nr:plasma kallikrein-like protein [Lasius niger]
MDGYARMEYMLALSLCLSCCVYALPHVALQDNRRNLPASNAQVHYNITNAEIDDRPAIDEVSYIDFDPAPSSATSSSKRPNVCKDCKTIDYTGAIATVVGWGRTGESKPVSDKLRKVNLPILSQEECDQAGYAKNRITENMFCSGYLDGGRDACFGDSGGPLHVKGVNGQLEVIGIVSWGRGCARPNFPGLYTKLTNYIGWLKDNLDEECICPPPHQQQN